ncbi:MAG: hypothetical protein ABSA30_08145, partial [Candidatus Aminicenantales bacterium]
LVWDIRAHRALGCERYRFNGHVADVAAEPSAGKTGWDLSVRSDGEFTLKAKASGAEKTFIVRKGANRFVLG